MMKKSIYIILAKITISIRNKLIWIADNIIPSRFLTLLFIQDFYIAYLIKTVVELKIADLLFDGPKNIEQLSKESNTDTMSLYRLLRALSGEGFFKEKKGKIFENSKKSKYFSEKHPFSIKHLLAHQLNNDLLEMYLKLKFSVETGKPASTEILGENPFDYMSHESEKSQEYNKAMACSTNLLYDIIKLYYPFEKFKIIADIGGGNGFLISKIISKKHHEKGIVVDLPHVTKKPHADLLSHEMNDNISFVGTDILHSIDIKADLYILKNILHAFGDIDCIKILKNIKKASHPESRIIILEMSLGKENEKRYGKQYDIQMLIAIKNGKERHCSEYKTLIESAGLKFSREIKTISPFNIYEAKV